MQSKARPLELRARRSPVFRLGDPEAVLPQIAAEQVADALIVIDDKNVRRVVRQSRHFEIERLIDGHCPVMRSSSSWNRHTQEQLLTGRKRY